MPTEAHSVTAKMPYAPSNSCTRAEMLTDAHLGSTRGLVQADCLHHLPSTGQAECQSYDVQNAAGITTPETNLSRSYISPASVNSSELTSYNENSDSIESDCCPDDVTHSYMTWRQNANNDSVLTPNKTLPSTPELPVWESSDLLDIPYASLFDLMDFQDSVVKMSSTMRVFSENIHSSSDTMSPKLSACSDLPKMTALHHSMEHMSTPCSDSSASCRQTLHVNSHVKPSNYGSEEAHLSHDTFDEPIVVRPPSKSFTKSLKDVSDNGDENNNSHFRTANVDFELESETGIYTHGRSLQENSEDDFQYQSERSSILRSDTELSILPQSSEETSRLLSSLSAPSSPSTAESSFLGLAYGDTLQQAGDREHTKQSTAQSAGDVLITERRLGLASGSLSWSDCELSSKLQHSAANQSVSETGFPLSFRDVSWSYHTLPSAQQNTPTRHGDRDSVNTDHYVTVRAKRPLRASMELKDAETGSAAKCRKVNAAAAISANTSHQGRAVKQRLPFKSPLKATAVDHHLTTGSDISDITSPSARITPYMACSGKYKSGLHNPGRSHCSAEVRLSQRKPLADQDVRRKPLARLAIDRHGNYNVPAESTRCRGISPDKDSDFCETSQDTSLPNHKDYKPHRGTNSRCYGEARQHRNNNAILRKIHVSNPHEDRAAVYILRDPATNEILERQVEGAENVPPSLVFPMTRQTRQVFRIGTHSQRQNFQHNSYSKKVNKQTRGRTGVSKMKLDRSSTLKTRSTKSIEHVREATSAYQRSHRTAESGRLKESTKTATSKSHRTHPIACSTLIRDDSSRTTDSDAENTSTWTLSEESNFCNFQKSNLCSTRINNTHQINHGSKPHAVLVSIATDTSTSSFDYQPHGKVFEISSIVSQIDKKLNHSRPISNTEVRNKRKDNTPKRFNLSEVTEDASSDKTFSAAQSPSQTLSPSNSSETPQFLDSHEGQCSAAAGEQTTMFSDQATASTAGKPSNEHNIPEASHWSYECKQSGVASVEDSLMHCQYYDDTDDLATTPTFEVQPDIHNKHSTSDDSSCSAARCRPRHSNQKPKTNQSSQHSSQSSQNTFNSVLTGSPLSVTPSGILAPDNSSSNMYNEHAGFYDYYSNVNINPLPNLRSFCPAVPTDYLMFETKVSGPNYYVISPGEKNYSDCVAECQTKATRNIGTCYHPLTSVSDAEFLVTQQSLANHQSQPTSSAVSTPCESASVSSERLDNRSMLVMAPPAGIDPSKSKNKHSLGQKLRKFRNNVYRKTKKFTHLHICE